MSKCFYLGESESENAKLLICTMSELDKKCWKERIIPPVSLHSY